MSDASRLQRELRELRTGAGIPAVAAVQVSASGIEAVAVDGLRRVDRPDPVELTDRFHIGSNTKAMTALLAALAVEDGTLAWDTGADEILLGVPRAPTLRQLLTHGAGLPPYADDDEVAAVPVTEGTPREQRAAFARFALSERPIFEAGTAHAYSNAGYAIAASMVESATDEAWEEALASQIFGPLGMEARVGWPALHGTDAPLGHRLVDGALQPHDPATDSYGLAPWLRPAGDVSLSIGDYGVFLADQLAGLAGHGRLGSAAMYRSLHTPDPADGEDGAGYALGWGFRETANGPISMHAGSAETFYAVVLLAPQRDRAIGVFANASADEHVVAVNALAKAHVAL